MRIEMHFPDYILCCWRAVSQREVFSCFYMGSYTSRKGSSAGSGEMAGNKGSEVNEKSVFSIISNRKRLSARASSACKICLVLSSCRGVGGAIQFTGRQNRLLLLRTLNPAGKFLCWINMLPGLLKMPDKFRLAGYTLLLSRGACYSFLPMAIYSF